MKTIAERLWSKVTKLPESEGGHWLFTGAKCSNGYGHIRVGKIKNVLVHRLTLAWATGEDGIGLDSAHDDSKRCPRNCVRPDHLEWKSHYDNMKDVARKNGRLGVRSRMSQEPLPLNGDSFTCLSPVVTSSSPS